MIAIITLLSALAPGQLIAERYTPPPSVQPSAVCSSHTYSTGSGSITHETSFGVNGDWIFDLHIPTFDSSLGTLVSIDIDMWLGLHRDFGIEVTSPTGRAAFYTSWDQPMTPPSPDDLGSAGPAWWRAQLALPTPMPPDVKWHERTGAVYAVAGGGFAFDRTHSDEKATHWSYTDAAMLNYFQGPGSLTQVTVSTTHHPSMWVVYTAGTTWQANGHSYNPARLVVTYNYL